MSKKKETRSASTQSANTYQLKIVLCHIKPSIWRELLVPGDSNLGLLHAIIQVSMGSANSHLHQYIINNQTYSDPIFGLDDDFDDRTVLDEGKTTLMEVVLREKESFVYEYEFGDAWEHRVTVEKILPPEPSMGIFSECIGGSRACPPEDCGGVSGYANLLEVIENPKHEEYDSMMEWLGGGFGPKAFDREMVDFYLRKLKWPRVTVDRLAKVLMQRDEYKG